MCRRPFYSLAFAAFIALSPIATSGATLTFDGVPEGVFGCPPNPSSIVESGFVISNCPGYFIEPGEIHLDDSGTEFQNSASFSANQPFDAESVVIQGLGWNFFDSDFSALSYDNVVFQGFRNGTLYASQSYSTFSLDPLELDTVLFDTNFALLDLLTITQVLPSADDFIRFPNAFCADAPCAHISLKAITLNPVPLPSGLMLILTALAMGCYFRWRKVFAATVLSLRSFRTSCA
jgi:hypothetical protein